MESGIAHQNTRSNSSGTLHLEEVIDAAKNFEPLNPTIVKLSSMLIDPNVGLNEISTLISYDQGLTLKLLKTANSAYVGSAMRITSVQEAISFIGEFKTLNLLLACTLGSQLRKSKLPAYEDVEGQLWRDSVLASITAEQCSKVFRVNAPPEATTSALLLNVGKVVLARFISEVFQERLSACQLNGKDQIEAEMEVLDIHFAEVGGLIAKHWGLPYEITVGISYQHDPDAVKNATSDVVHICYKLVEFFSKSPSVIKEELTINPNVIERLQPSSRAWLEVLRELVKERYLKVCRSYDLPENDLIPPNWESNLRLQDAPLQSAHA